jgi:anti-anti-sigma regulatory factor
LTGETEVAGMATPHQMKNPTVVFMCDAMQPFLEQLRDELRQPAVEAVTIDMGQVLSVDPGALSVLADAAEQARAADKPVFVDHVRTTVYKALQLARLATLFRRVHHG